MQKKHTKGKLKGLPIPDGIFECPQFPKEEQNPDDRADAQKLEWANAMLPMMRDGYVQFSWVRLAALLGANEILAVKLHAENQAQSLFHACTRKKLNVVKRRAEESAGGSEAVRQVIYIFLREHELRMPFGAKVYGQGRRLARMLLTDKTNKGIRLYAAKQADALRQALRLIITKEHAAEYARWRDENGPRKAVCVLEPVQGGKPGEVLVRMNEGLRIMIK